MNTCSYGPSMQIILLTGMSGVGKSAIVAALRDMGYNAVDMDETGWSYVDDRGHQRWHEARLQATIDVAQEDLFFIAGCSESQIRFYPQLTHVILLSAPWSVMIERLQTRSNSSYGKTAEELLEIRQNLEEVEPLLRQRATHEIITVEPLDVVMAQILGIVCPTNPGGNDAA